MISVFALWLPIFFSAILVFIASSIIHMVLPYHKNDFSKLPGEDHIRAAFLKNPVSPGDYAVPHAVEPREWNTADVRQKFEEGPVAFVTVVQSGMPAMGKNLAQWFAFSVVVGVIAAYVAGRTLEPGAEYLEVFRITGTVAFTGYALAFWQQSIWYGRKWSASAKTTFDGLIYALLTAGVFGWLWP